MSSGSEKLSPGVPPGGESEDAETILRMEGVSFVRKGETILHPIHWRVRRGEHWIVLGPNGSGKSTLASFVGAFQWPSRGRVAVLGERLGGVDVRDLRKRLGLFEPVLQERSSLHHPHMTALDMVSTGYDGSLAPYSTPPAPVLKEARELLRSLPGAHPEAPSFPEDRPFALLSSGERRKVLLLRLFLSHPELILLDEPYESLDIPSRFSLEELLVEHVRSRGTPTITILHRVEEIPPFATHALLLKEGDVLEQGRVESLVNSSLLSRLYDYPLEVGKRGEHYFCMPRRSGGERESGVARESE